MERENAALKAQRDEAVAACKAMSDWYATYEEEYEDERSAFVGACEFEALMQDNDDGLAKIVEQARTAITHAEAK